MLPAVLIKRTTTIIAAAEAEHASPIDIEQNATTSWTQRGKAYHRYAVTVTNKSTGKTVQELHIGISKLYGPVWGVDKARYGYVLPSLPAGKSATFVYIHAAPAANVWVTGYKLV
jgi:endoglucanase